MKKTITRRFFTLLELMVTITILAICFSVIGIKVNKALYKHKYRNNIKKIDMYFTFCKKMALSNQADIYLKLYQEKDKTCFEMGTDDFSGFFENIKKTKDVFDDMFFLFNQKKVNEMEIIFSSTGEILPKGNLEFFDKKKIFKEIKKI